MPPPLFTILDFAPPSQRAGVQDGTIDAAATFAEAGRYFRTNPTKLHQLWFPEGEYKSSEGWHFIGVPKLKIHGSGASIYAHGFISGKINSFFLGQSPFYFTPDLENNLHQNDQTKHGGYSVVSAEAGADTITLASSVDADLFLPGAVGFIHGFNIFRAPPGGEPPSLLFFEWFIVDSVDDVTLTLRAPLKHTYRSSWYEYPNASLFQQGPALVIPWEARGCQIYSTIEGIDFRPKEGSDLNFPDNAGAFQNQSFYAEYTNLQAPLATTAPATSFYTRYENCVFKQIELDKLVETCDINQCTFKIVNAGTNVRNLYMKNSVVSEQVTIVGGNADYENCCFPAGSRIFSNIPGHVKLHRCSFQSDGGANLPLALSYGAGDGDPPDTTTRQVVDVLNENGRATKLTFASAFEVYKLMAIDDVLLCQSLAGVGYELCLVVGFDQDVNGNDVLLVKSTGECLTGKVLFATDQNSYEIEQCSILPLDGEAVSFPYEFGFGNGTSTPRHEGRGVVEGQTSFYDNPSIWNQIGRVVKAHSLKVDVTRPYTGPDASALLVFQMYFIDQTWNGTNSTVLQPSIDLRTPGVRHISISGASALLGADADFDVTHTTITNGESLLAFNRPIVISSAGFGKLTGDKNTSPDRSVLPIVSARFEFDVIGARAVAGIVGG